MKNYHLTEPQKRIWYLQMIYPNSAMFNIGGTVTIRGNVETSRLVHALKMFIRTNDALQIRIRIENGIPVQYFTDVILDHIDFEDFSNFVDGQAELDKWLDELAARTFDMVDHPLYYFTVFKLSERVIGYCIKFHHIIADGWSMQLLTQQIEKYYRVPADEVIANISGKSYQDFIQAEFDYIKSERYLKHKKYWMSKFTVLPENLPQVTEDISGFRESFYMTLELSDRIRELCNHNNISVNAFFVTVYLLYLHKTNGQCDITVGIPVLGRFGKKQREIFGMFVSSMPFRYQVEPLQNTMKMLKSVDHGIKECFKYQQYPYNHLLKDIDLASKGCSGLYNTCINYYNTRHSTIIEDMPVSNAEFYNGQQEYSFQMVIRDWEDCHQIQLDFDCHSNEYSKESVQYMYQQLSCLIASVIHKQETLVADLSFLEEEERNKLVYGFNKTECIYDTGKTVVDLFRRQSKETPGNIAVCMNNDKYTYQELDDITNRLAAYLVKKGARKNDIIGILVDHSIEMVIGILGILKSGAAYLPLDVNHPMERINYMLSDAGVKILLTNITFTHSDIEVVPLTIAMYENDTSVPFISISTDDLAYIIYTSGSTGEPKGTLIQHKALKNYACWAKKMYCSGRDEVFPLFTSIAFDLTITSIFPPLISGNQVIVYRDDEDEYVLYRIIKDKKATVIKMTPSQLSLLKDFIQKESSVRRFILGGEELKVSLAKKIDENFEGNVEIINEYGPTEATVGCMIHIYDREKDLGVSVPIGKPADNTQIYILDRSRNPVPINMNGEIYISGEGLAKGYQSKQDQTLEKFIDNPFIAGQKMYQTGDCARFIDSSRILYMGRLDQQIKIRGYRIELVEIETCILSAAEVLDAVVVDYKRLDGSIYLCAYIVKCGEMKEGDLHQFLALKLPEYMIPSYFIFVDSIPLTDNGKLDKKKLPSVQESDVKFVDHPIHKGMEKLLAVIISEALDTKIVSGKQNFYHCGGDSIKAIQVSSRLGKMGYQLQVKDILRNPVIENMAMCVCRRNKPIKDQGKCQGNVAVTPIVSWFLSQQFKNPGCYNQNVCLRINKIIAVEKLSAIIHNLIVHHDGLRINLRMPEGELFYNEEHLKKPFLLEEYYLTSQIDVQGEYVIHNIRNYIDQNFNIEKDLLVRGCVLHSLSGDILLISIHHLVTDGVSWRIILEDINTLLDQYINDMQLKLCAKTVSYQKWAGIVEKQDLSGKEKSYWEHEFCKVLDLITMYSGKEPTFYESSTFTLNLDKYETQQLLFGANVPYRTKVNELVITALLLSLKDKNKSDELVIELEGHGREELSEPIDISRTVGWFTSMFPFYINLGAREISNQIIQVKDALRKIPRNGFGFGMFENRQIYYKKYSKSLIRFNYLGEFSKAQAEKNICLEEDGMWIECDLENVLTSVMDINCYVSNNQFIAAFRYSNRHFENEAAKAFAESILYNLKKIIAHCCNRKTIEFTSSDFDTVDLTVDEIDAILLNET